MLYSVHYMKHFCSPICSFACPWLKNIPFTWSNTLFNAYGSWNIRHQIRAVSNSAEWMILLLQGLTYHCHKRSKKQNNIAQWALVFAAQRNQQGAWRDPYNCVTGVTDYVKTRSSFCGEMWVQGLGTCILVKPQLLSLKAGMKKQEARKGGGFIFYYITSLCSEAFWFR